MQNLEPADMADAPAAPQADLLAQLFAANVPETAVDMRAMLDRFAGMMNGDAPTIGACHEGVHVRDVDGAQVTADVMVPKGDGPHPVLVYLHGGGWICGSPATHRKLCHRFAEAGYLTISVDYRLAPEHPFPAAFDDCEFAVHWAAREAARWGGDASRLAIGGDSAGGNLSAAVAAALCDDPDAPRLSAALLIYGVFDFATIDGVFADDLLAASEELAEAGEKLLELMIGSYLGSEPSDTLLADPRVSPLQVASKLPPSHVMVGSADGLAGQAAALVAALEREGVEHEHVVYDGMPHGFAQMEFFPPARDSIDRMVEFLGKHLGA
jgi:acetyl esterase